MFEIENIETPCYIFDEKRFLSNLNKMKDSFSKFWNNDVIIGYSFKTNSLPYLLNLIRRNNCYAEIVSSDEYALARKIGFSIKNIIFNGPIKGNQAIIDVLEAGGIVNLDNFSEIELISEKRPKKQEYWKIGLRINFNLEKECPSETIMGNEPGRFGFNIENGSFEKAVQKIQKLNYVKIVGLHGHHSTKTKSINVFKTISKKLVECSKIIVNDFEYVDIGGCFFGDKSGAPSFDEYAKVISEELRKTNKFHNAKLIVEPGTSLDASSFSYVCEIADIKEVDSKRILTSNGSLIHIDPQMHGIKFKTKILSKNNVKYEGMQIVSGFTCIEKDRMVFLENENELSIGDKIIFENTGAYSLALSPLFIQFFPIVYLLEDNKLRIIRNKWTCEDYLSKCEVD